MKKIRKDLKRSKLYCYLILLALGILIFSFILYTTIINFSQLRVAMTFLIFINLITLLVEMLQYLEKINDYMVKKIKFTQLFLYVILAIIIFCFID